MAIVFWLLVMVIAGVMAVRGVLAIIRAIGGDGPGEAGNVLVVLVLLFALWIVWNGIAVGFSSVDSDYTILFPHDQKPWVKDPTWGKH